MSRPRLALVPGEPAGVGPELCARILAGTQPAELVVYGDADQLRACAAKLGIALPAFAAVEFPNAVAATPGRPDPRNAPAVIAALKAANVKHEWHETAGDHSWPVWRGYLSEFLPRLFQ